MTFAVLLAAAIGYALIYAAMPNRTVLRERTRARTRRLLVTGAAILLLSAVLGAIEFGPVTGPCVTLAAGVAAGSVLVLIGPFLVRETA
jgi:hypothetical protein